MKEDVEEVTVPPDVGHFAGQHDDGCEDEDGEERSVVQEAPVGACFLMGPGEVGGGGGVGESADEIPVRYKLRDKGFVGAGELYWVQSHEKRGEYARDDAFPCHADVGASSRHEKGKGRGQSCRDGAYTVGSAAEVVGEHERERDDADTC